MRCTDRPRAWLAGAGIALAAIAAHARSLTGGFVFDDHSLVARSEALRGPLADLWLGRGVVDYWPLTYTSLWVDWRLFGDQAWGYHAVNVLLHAAVAVLLWRVLLALRIPGAAIAAVLFAVHPVTVESVAWISERKNVLSGVFYLAAALGWLRFEATRRTAWWAGSFALFVLALLAKTSTVMLPVVLLGLVLVRRRSLSWPDALRLAPFFAASAAAGLVTLRFQGALAMANIIPAERGLGERLGAAGWALASYLQKAFVPANLAMIYPDWPVAPGSPAFYVPVLLLVALGTGLALGGARTRPVAWAVAYHAIVLVPVLGFVEIAYFSIAPVSNHLQYLALFGPVALVGAGLAQLARLSWPRAAPAAAAALAIAFAASTVRRTAAFHDDEALWATASRDTPGSIFAGWMYADTLAARGDRAGALAALERVAAHARTPDVRHRARALHHAHEGLAVAALQEARLAASVRPSPNFDLTLGMILARAGSAAEAVEVLTPVFRRAPWSDEACYWLAASLARLRRYAEAAEVLRGGLAAIPGDARLMDALQLVESR